MDKVNCKYYKTGGKYMCIKTGEKEVCSVIVGCREETRNAPKPAKDVKFKGWCIVRDAEIGEIDGSFESGDTRPKHFGDAYTECTIVITAANWKKIKGGK